MTGCPCQVKSHACYETGTRRGGELTFDYSYSRSELTLHD